MTTSGRYGLIGGLAVGLLGGILASGPHLREWSLLYIFLVMLGGGAIGAIVGYLALTLFTSSLASQPGGGIGDGGIGGVGISGSSHNDGGDGGGDG